MLNCTLEDVAMVSGTLGCQIVELPLTSLGIPLMLRQPTSTQMQPHMNKAGWLALVKFVLNAMSIHQIGNSPHQEDHQDV